MSPRHPPRSEPSPLPRRALARCQKFKRTQSSGGMQADRAPGLSWLPAGIIQGSKEPASGCAEERTRGSAECGGKVRMSPWHRVRGGVAAGGACPVEGIWQMMALAAPPSCLLLKIELRSTTHRSRGASLGRAAPHWLFLVRPLLGFFQIFLKSDPGTSCEMAMSSLGAGLPCHPNKALTPVASQTRNEVMPHVPRLCWYWSSPNAPFCLCCSRGPPA